MTNFAAGDRVRCIKVVPAATLPGVLIGNMGWIDSISSYGRFPFRVLWDKSILSDKPYFCRVSEDEIEMVN